MLIITIRVNAPAGQAIGIKEAFAMDAEKYGDVLHVDVQEVEMEQMGMEGSK